MKRFEILDHTADVGLRGYGRILEELFAHMALGMLGLVAETTTVQPMASIPIMAQADDLELLLVAWLKEILFAAERDHLVFVNCRVMQVMPTAVTSQGAVVRPPFAVATGEATGEALDPTRHTVFREIKAVTRHELSVRREGDLWVAQEIFDI